MNSEIVSRKEIKHVFDIFWVFPDIKKNERLSQAYS